MKRLGMSLLVMALASEMVQALPEEMSNLLKEAGAVSYAADLDYGSGVSAMALGFNAEGDVVAGVASRETKTYRTITTVIAVVPTEGKYKIMAAESPNVSDIPGAAQGYTKSALEDISGRIFANEKDVRSLTDATTGATKYYKAIYVSYGVMATRVIKEMNNLPDWERKPLS